MREPGNRAEKFRYYAATSSISVGSSNGARELSPVRIPATPANEGIDLLQPEGWNEFTLRGDFTGLSAKARLAPKPPSGSAKSNYRDASAELLPMACAGMSKHRRNFTPSDDALIRQQPIMGIGLKILETLLRTNCDALTRWAEEHVIPPSGQAAATGTICQKTHCTDWDCTSSA